MTDTAISRQVDLEQLVLPEQDVRQGRDADDIRSLAASMGDPDVGQQQPITVYPNDFADVVDDGTEDELAEIFEDGHPLVIHDGVSRYRAAQMLGWATIWAVITPEPPESDVVARLEANTERLDMSDHEIYAALKDHYDTTDATLEAIGEKVGVDASYVSRVFSLFDAPDVIYDAWAHPDHPLETSHAMAADSLLSQNSLEQYARAGDLTEEDAYQLALGDVKTMVDVQQRHECTVTDYRQRVKRCRKETLDGLEDQRSMAQKQADAQTEDAERTHDHYAESDHAQMTCLVCGTNADRKYAIPVCEQDYGMLADMEAQGDVLMAQAEVPENPPDPPAPSPEGSAESREAILSLLEELPDEEVDQLHEQLQDALTAPQEAPDG